ncbi:formimidoylglutamase [Hirschia maritima]|uniref:formimidoylglutamase n=1 Tax=Hirschia maritima TaxID=1121961 RepID=UPI0003649E77|nr:formimidoylglutamase [Hirschia maritima]
MPVFHKSAQRLMCRADPEDGENAKRVAHFQSESGPNAIIGFACEAGVLRNKGRGGAKEAPTTIRQSFAGLAAPTDFKPFVDLGDVVVDGDDLEQGQDELGKRIGEALAIHSKLIVFGGGHETAFASYLGLRSAYPDKRIGIINLDAHLDLRNIGEAGPSSGTPFNQIKQLEKDQFDYLCIGVAQEANTEALFMRARKWGVKLVSDKALVSDLISADVEIEEITKRCDLIYLTIDIDVLPHYQAPGVSAPAARGVSLSVIEYIIDKIKTSCAVYNCVMPLADLVEVSPKHDKDNMTSKTAAILACSLLR